MNSALQETQKNAGATFGTIAEQTVPLSFGNDADAVQAAVQTAALYDRSHWGRLELSGDDRLRFLHNQTTNQFEQLQPGKCCDTVFVTSTARTLDLVTACVLDDSVLLLTHPNSRRSLLQWMDRFIFPFDKVKLTDRTEETAAFSLIGPQANQILQTAGAIVPDLAPGTHQQIQLGSISVRIAASSGLAAPGYTLFIDAVSAVDLWQALSEAGAAPLGEQAWEILRIQQGRPIPGAELTEDYNPLEAGLWHTISFSKGCYIGQETIARLDTYDGVKQQLFGIRLNQVVPAGAPIYVGDNKVGQLTSVVQTPSGIQGLGYIRKKAGGTGLTVRVNDVEGEVTELPFLTRSRQETPS